MVKFSVETALWTWSLIARSDVIRRLMDTKNLANNVVRVAIYVRVACVGGSDRRDVIRQRLELEKYAKDRNWQVVRVYIDAGVSGRGSGGPELKALVSDAERSPRPFDILLVRNLSRLSGDIVSLMWRMDHLESLGLYVWFPGGESSPIDYWSKWSETWESAYNALEPADKQHTRKRK